MALYSVAVYVLNAGEGSRDRREQKQQNGAYFRPMTNRLASSYFRVALPFAKPARERFCTTEEVIVVGDVEPHKSHLPDTKRVALQVNGFCLAEPASLQRSPSFYSFQDPGANRSSRLSHHLVFSSTPTVSGISLVETSKANS